MRIGGMMRINRITGRVLNWSPVEISGLHVYSLVMKSRHIIDATGHAIEVVKVVEKNSAAHKSARFGRTEALTSQNPFIPS